MALNKNAIVTLLEAKTWIPISPVTDTTWDTILENLINVVSTMIEDFVGRRVVEQLTSTTPDTITEIWTGDGTSTHFVNHPPIQSVTSLAIEDETAVDTTDTDEFRKDSETGEIFLADGRIFTEAPPLNCTLVYVGGWPIATAPRPIWQAALDEVKRLYKDRAANRDPIQSVSMEGQSIVYVQEQGLSRDAQAKLAPYVTRRFA